MSCPPSLKRFLRLAIVVGVGVTKGILNDGVAPCLEFLGSGGRMQFSGCCTGHQRGSCATISCSGWIPLRARARAGGN